MSLSRAQIDYIVAEANRRAALSGKTPEQEAIAAGVAEGMSNADIEQAMGWAEGAIDNYTGANMANTLAGTPWLTSDQIDAGKPPAVGKPTSAVGPLTTTAKDPVVPDPVVPAPVVPAPVVQTVAPYINPVTRTDIGPATAGSGTTAGATSPIVTGSQNVFADVAGDGNVVGNNNTTGSYNTSNTNTYNGWGTAGNAAVPTINTPMLDALYAQRQQAMQVAPPQFNFRAPAVRYKRGGKVEGALTRCIKGH